MLEATVEWLLPDEAQTNIKLRLSVGYEWRTTPKRVRLPISRKNDFATVFVAEERCCVARSSVMYIFQDCREA